MFNHRLKRKIKSKYLLFSIILITSVLLMNNVQIFQPIHSNKNQKSGPYLKESLFTNVTPLNITFGLGSGYFNISGGYSILATNLTSSGYNVTQIDHDPTAKDLLNTNILVLSGHTYTNYSEETELIVYNFVKNGGAIVMDSGSDGLDFGVKTTNLAFGVLGSHAMDTYPHVLTQGLTHIDVAEGATLKQMTISADAQVLVSTTTTINGHPYTDFPMIAATTFGAGKVMATAAGFWANSLINSGSDNINLFHNFINWYETDNSMNYYTNKPSVSGPGTITIAQNENLNWQIQDKYPFNYTIFNNDSIIKHDYWINGTITISGLSIGYYNYTILVEDAFGNTNVNSIYVTIEQAQQIQKPPQSSFPSPTQSSSLTSISLSDSFGLNGLITIFSINIVFLIVLAIEAKRYR